LHWIRPTKQTEEKKNTEIKEARIQKQDGSVVSNVDDIIERRRKKEHHQQQKQQQLDTDMLHVFIFSVHQMVNG
jgi:hypothetical protein